MSWPQLPRPRSRLFQGRAQLADGSLELKRAGGSSAPPSELKHHPYSLISDDGLVDSGPPR
jgi:hypothetical protein